MELPSWISFGVDSCSVYFLVLYIYILIYLIFMSSGCMLEHSMSYFMHHIILKHIWKWTFGLYQRVSGEL